MDHFHSLKNSIAKRIWFGSFVLVLANIAIWVLLINFGFSRTIAAVVCAFMAGLTASLLALWITKVSLEPLKNVRQAILHVGVNATGESAPNLEQIRIGRELVSSLALQVYDLASKSPNHSLAATAQSEDPSANIEANSSIVGGQKMLNATPLPIFSVDEKSNVHYINDAALDYLGISREKRPEIVGKNVNDVLNLSFPSEQTYEKWLADCQKSVVKAGTTWNRVRLVDPNGNPLKQFDMAASYSKGGEVESVIVMFDHTESYASDDQEISFVAMAVHELRTPLTIMRGYIEVFEDELGPTLNPELKSFMQKMQASAQQLTAFVSNILNVARVEENQLVLTLRKDDWAQVLKGAVEDLQMRAQVHKKTIELNIQPNLPAVAIDRISIHEVINNLVDNAIKYSGESGKIVITSSLNEEGWVQTSVQDFGVGIPLAVMPKLFDKFYRSHRSRVQIGGTGLGLYLSKAIVTAHGGNIGVKSKEGEGSIFSFTIEPFSEAKHSNPEAADGIMRGAHGWIKNHSMYRQ